VSCLVPFLPFHALTAPPLQPSHLSTVLTAPTVPLPLGSLSLNALLPLLKEAQVSSSDMPLWATQTLHLLLICNLSLYTILVTVTSVRMKG
jgi:hypothetical protein